MIYFTEETVLTCSYNYSDKLLGSSGWPSHALQLSFQRDNTGLEANYQSYHYFWSSSPGFPCHISPRMNEAQSHNLLSTNLFYTKASSCLSDWICFSWTWNLFTLKNTALHCGAAISRPAARGEGGTLGSVDVWPPPPPPLKVGIFILRY